MEFSVLTLTLTFWDLNYDFFEILFKFQDVYSFLITFRNIIHFHNFFEILFIFMTCIIFHDLNRYILECLIIFMSFWEFTREASSNICIFLLQITQLRQSPQITEQTMAQMSSQPTENNFALDLFSFHYYNARLDYYSSFQCLIHNVNVSVISSRAYDQLTDKTMNQEHKNISYFSLYLLNKHFKHRNSEHFVQSHHRWQKHLHSN